MHLIRHLPCCFLAVLFIYHANTAFTPNINDYDAYGLKITMNDYLLVLAQNGQYPPTFFIQFAPYNDTRSPSCTLTYPNATNTFIYTVAIGKKQQQLNQTRFFFAGEMINDQNGPFIGMATYNYINNSNTSQTSSASCDTSFSYSVQYLDYEHQEYYILGVDPNGFLAYGFSNKFVVVLDSTNNFSSKTWNGSSTWRDSSFIPHAVDVNEKFGVIAGFIRNADNATVKYNPMVYLINFNSSDKRHPVVVDQYQPIPSAGSWQDLLTNDDADVYSPKYDMSVGIDDQGKVLVGMQFNNRVLSLSVNITNPTNFTYINRNTGGRSLGNGKSVAWLNDGIAAILINDYTLSYKWSLSQIFYFDIYRSRYEKGTLPLSVFPNSHQVLPSNFSSIFLNVVSSSSSLALLDDKGKILIFSPTPVGFYPMVQTTTSMPFITSPVACMAGTYKNKVGIYGCSLCPMGTKNPGNSSIQCVPCASESFCPLGSVADISQSALETIFQVIPYPHSPESVIFDEILLHNMFTIGSGRCIVVSPLFWSLVVGGLVILIIILMEIMDLFITDERSKTIRNLVQTIFRHTDLIGEGEYWISGLISFSILVLVSFAFAFSSQYVKQYPIENSSPSYFTCDTSLRNAKFETNVQSLAIPFTHEEQEMFNLLNQQNFTLNVDFINTQVKCDAIWIEGLFGLTWSTILWRSCNNTGSILTLFIELPYQHISVKVLLEDVKTMGAIGIGLTGPGYENGSYRLEELTFHQVFSQNGHILSRTLPVVIAMTKIINETKPMVGEESDFGGIYVPTFTVDPHSLFNSNDQYVRSAMTLTTLTIEISETPYYIKNLQQPIARQPEIIFRNLLFTVVCLEIFGLVFLSYKLALKPFYFKIIRGKFIDKHKKKIAVAAENNNSDVKVMERL